ncbi:MAG: hypothetical protein M3Q44_01235 [bacterium]|nr:hypothetical protein [bacterium]
MDANVKRYFKKRDRRIEEVSVKENPLDFPQNSLPIPAGDVSKSILSWVVFNTLVYSGVLIFAVIQLANFFPVPRTSASFADALIVAPLSYRSHLLYLESLTVKNRLDEAQHESDFLLISEKIFVPTSEELSNFSLLRNNISTRKVVFHTTMDEYTHWNEVLETNPDYRDGFYSLAQRAYMLFDDGQAKNYLRRSVDLDPQFEQGKKVLRMLGN